MSPAAKLVEVEGHHPPGAKLVRIYPCVMTGLGPVTHDFAVSSTASREWPVMTIEKRFSPFSR
jgi:hypothetical protein